MDDLEQCYEVLGLKRDASPEAIDRAYRFMATAFHPDKFPTPDLKQRAEARMKEINKARDRILAHLRDQARREAEEAQHWQPHRGSAEARDRREAGAWRERAAADQEASEGPADSRIWRMYYSGVGAYQRGDRAKARGLLTEVARRKPQLVLGNRPVEEWLRMNEGWIVSPHERYYLRLIVESVAFGAPGLLMFFAGARFWGMSWIAFTTLLVIFRLQSSHQYLRGYTGHADTEFDEPQESDGDGIGNA